MQLTKEQKSDLKSLTQHRGFKILEEIVEEKRQSLFWEFENLPLWDLKVMERLWQTQNFNKWMKYLIDTAKDHTKETIKAPNMS